LEKSVNEHPAEREKLQVLKESIIPGIFLINLSANFLKGPALLEPVKAGMVACFPLCP
jgi:hypothetical protein